MHRPLYSSSVHPSISRINPPIHPPTKPRQVIQWTHYFLLWKTKIKPPLGFRWPKTRSATSNCGNTVEHVGERAERWKERWTDRGGSKCQVPLGSEDGGYIYQSKQPRGAEYFTCLCGLLHYHIHQSLSVPIQPLTIQNSYSMQNGGCYKMLNCSWASR